MHEKALPMENMFPQDMGPVAVASMYPLPFKLPFCH